MTTTATSSGRRRRLADLTMGVCHGQPEESDHPRPLELDDSLRPDDGSDCGQQHQAEANAGEPGRDFMAMNVVADDAADLAVDRVQLACRLGGERG